MIAKEKLHEIINTELIADVEFLVSLSISPRNEIRILIDSLSGISIDRCVTLSRAIEAHLDRDVDDFSLEVSSAGLGEPFQHPLQYKKNLAKPVSVVLKSGVRHDGVLLDVTDNGFSITEFKVIPAHTDENGRKKKKETVEEVITFLFDDVKSTSYRFEK